MYRRNLLAMLCACVLLLNCFAMAETVKPSIKLTSDAAATVDALNDGLCSWSQGGTDDTTLDGNDYSLTPAVYVTNGRYAAAQSVAGEQEYITDTALDNVEIESDVRGTNGIVIYASDYAITNTSVSMNTADEDGFTSCDFSGKGAALAVYGNSDVTVTDSVLKAAGVANLGLFVDNGASVLLDSSVLYSEGGTLYEGYVNSPNQSTMVAPPWILGIMGTSRASNLMGSNSTLTVVDSETSASNWAVLSTDSGNNMVLNVVNSSLTLTGSNTPMQADGLFDTVNPYTERSGYGTYVIGNATEKFLGVTMDVGTYATIFTGGSAYYGNLVKGETYELTKADGTVHTTYTADEDVRTVINSDTFGFMAHQDNNSIVLDGIQVNSGFTTFMVKSGNNTDITITNGAELNAENGILLQLFDNDDATTEFDSESMAFGMTHEEYAGFPTEAVADSTTAGKGGMDPSAGQMSEGDNLPEMPEDGMGGNPPEMPEGGMGGNSPEMPEDGIMDEQAGSAAEANTTTFTVKDTELNGDLFNGIGWNANALSSGNVKQMVLNVNLQSGAVLNGSIASASCIHVTYDGQIALKEAGITAFDDETEAAAFAAQYQATSFTQSEYFNICQVANLVKSNDLNDIYVSLTEDAVWNVTGTSLINSLTIEDNAAVIIADGVTLTVDDQVYTAGTYTAEDF